MAHLTFLSFIPSLLVSWLDGAVYASVSLTALHSLQWQTVT